MEGELTIMNLQSGMMLARRYRILRELGRGGMSTVFLARDEHFPHVQRLCALKIIRASEDPTLAELQRIAFEREASLLATLRHPAIPQVYDFFYEDGRCCLVLEYIDGEDLERYLARLGSPIPEPLLIEWTLELLDVLEYLHSQHPQPIVFRDLKPSNIMRRQDGSLCLIDFGIARLFQPQTRGTMIGTEGYAPPEQYRGVADPRSDLYALGATLYHLATGNDPRDQPPFSLTERPPRSVNPALSSSFEAIILRALAYDPAERFPSASAMAQAVRALREPLADPSHPRPPSLTRPAVGAEGSFRIHWSFRTSDEVRGSPLLTDDLVVFGSYDGTLYALDAPTGYLRWRFPTGRGIPTTPCDLDGAIVFGSDDGAIYCLERNEGAFLWRYRTAGPVRASPTAAGEFVAIGSDDSFLYVLASNSGGLIWRWQAGGPVRATPLVVSDRVVIAADDGTITLRVLSDGQLLWRSRLLAPIWSRPVLDGTNLIVASLDGTVMCLPLEGGNPLWVKHFDDAFVASAVLWGKLLILAGNAGHIFACYPQSGEIVWELDVEDRIASTPVPYRATLLVATGTGKLLSITRNGEIIRTDDLGTPIVATPAIAGSLVYIGALDGRLYALDLTEREEPSACYA